MREVRISMVIGRRAGEGPAGFVDGAREERGRSVGEGSARETVNYFIRTVDTAGIWSEDGLAYVEGTVREGDGREVDMENGEVPDIRFEWRGV